MIFQSFNSGGILNFNHYTYKNFSFSSHFHKNIEFVYVADGEIEITVNDITLKASKGQFAIVLPYHMHSFKTSVTSSAVVAVFSNDFISNFISETNHKTAKNFIFVTDENIIHKFCNLKELNNFQIMGVLYSLCGDFINQTEFINAGNDNGVILNKIMNYINENHNHDITLSTLSDAIGYEKHYISRLFNASSGMNFRSFINMCRTENAREMLKNTNMTITEIAYACGFSNIRTFNRAFREFTGCSPNEYRK